MSTLVKNGHVPTSTRFNELFPKNLFDWSMNQTVERTMLPKVNIVETNDSFLVEMAAPGLSKKQFQIELDNDLLTISSKTEENKDDNPHYNYTRREFSYHSFTRSFYLPNTVEVEKIEATYKNGLLCLTIPKKEEARKKPVKTIKIA